MQNQNKSTTSDPPSKFNLTKNSFYYQKFTHQSPQNSFSPPNNRNSFPKHRNPNRAGRNFFSPHPRPHSSLRKPSEKEIFDTDFVSQGINFDQYDNIQTSVSGADCPPPIENFSDLEELHEQLKWNIARCGYQRPTPVQKYALPISLAGIDLMSVAQTGSGKTAAFLLPVAQFLLSSGEPPSRSPRALVLTPTRELACQIQQQALKYTFGTEYRSQVVYGGSSLFRQKSLMARGADVLVATPGRLLDMLERRFFCLDRVRFLILDEADRMLDMGFEEQLRAIMAHLPAKEQRQTMMFSATFPREIRVLAANFMNEYAYVAVGRVGGTSENVKQEVLFVDVREKGDVLLDFFESIDEKSVVLIFVQRKVSAGKVENFLVSHGIESQSIHGDKPQSDRDFALSNFKRGICRVLVATDVASRGLDIPNVTYVVNYDMSSNIDDYVHRIGRTGRIGNEGIALSLITEMDNAKVLEDLKKVLEESNETVPEWMDEKIALKKQNSRSSRNYRGRYKSSNRGRSYRNYGGFGNGGNNSYSFNNSRF